LKIKDSVVAEVSTAIQNGAIISIDFMEQSPTYPRWEMVEWYTNPHTIFILSCTLPDNHFGVTSRDSVGGFFIGPWVKINRRYLDSDRYLGFNVAIWIFLNKSVPFLKISLKDLLGIKHHINAKYKKNK